MFDLSNQDYIQDTGWTTIRKERIFVAGRTVLGGQGPLESGAFLLNDKLGSLCLDIDPMLSPQEAGRIAENLLIAGGPISICATLYYLYTLLQPLFADAGWNRSFVCYLVGRSQSRKTTFAEILTGVCNRSTQPMPEGISLLSTFPAVLEELNRYPGLCRLLDDLYDGTSKAESRRREEKVSEIIRLVGNRASRGKIQGRANVASAIPCGVICTAEYLPQGYSTLARCLILEVEKPFRSDCLTELQLRPLAWPTFLYYFLIWCADRYDKLVDMIKKDVNEFSQKRDTFNEEGRLLEIQKSLEWTGRWFVEYCSSIHKFRNEYCRKIFQGQLRQKLFGAISNIISNQNALLERSDGQCFSTALAEMYVQGKIRITEKFGDRFMNGTAAVKHKGCLCMRSNYLIALINNYFDDSSITLEKICKELRNNGLLSMDMSRKSTKKCKGVRAVHIHIDLLESYGPPDIFSDLPPLLFDG